MEKVRPWCGQPSDRGRLKNRTEECVVIGSCEGLTMEQVDALWNCLAVDPLSSDDCLNWFLTTAKSKDYHALSINTMRHIFIDKVRLLYLVLS